MMKWLMSGSLCGLVVLLVGACSSEDPRQSVGAAWTEERCGSIIAQMSACYPDLASEAVCDAATVAEYDRLGLEQRGCDGIEQIGKADLFAYRGCDSGQHVCNWIFCCADYVITWFPKSAADWDIKPAIDAFQSAVPAGIAADFAGAERASLEQGITRSYIQEVAEQTGTAPLEMAVEVTQKLVNVPFGDFGTILPAPRWGVELDHYLGGEVKVYQKNAQDRVTRQLERMVLSPFPIDIEGPLSNNDITKVEVIEYGVDSATVYWRARHSNNGATETDIGSVSFRRYDAASTLITFHSAHRLNAPGKIHIPSSVAALALEGMFLDFADRYADILSDK